MKLLDFEEISDALSKEYGVFKDGPFEIGLKKLAEPTGSLPHLSTALRVTLPFSFLDVLGKWDFSRVTIGPIVFSTGDGGYLDEVLLRNRENPSWRNMQGAAIWIAVSDPYTFLLDTSTGRVIGSDSEGALFDVASDFELFVRGAGTIFVRRIEGADTLGLAKDVAASVGAKHDGVWNFLAR